MKKAPTQAEYRVPQNQIEHNQIVARLVEGGSIPSEIEIVIAISLLYHAYFEVINIGNWMAYSMIYLSIFRDLS